MTSFLFGIILLFFSPGPAHATETIFEGYYRIDLQSKAVGYAILRYEFDPKSSTFTALSFLRAKFGDSVVQESLKAKVTDKFKPISYAYTSQTGETAQMIDATFNGDVMKLKISDGKKVKDETYKNPKGTFLSIFLPFLLLTKKMAPGETFQYSAVAEEDGGSYNGRALLQSRESGPGYDVFTIVNKFKGDEFYSKMAVIRDPKNADKNIKGEVLSTQSPAKNVSTKLMAQASLATEGQLVPNSILLKVFGGMPVGKINLIATPLEPATPAPKSTAAHSPPGH
jgi:hypothetical protein